MQINYLCVYMHVYLSMHMCSLLHMPECVCNYVKNTFNGQERTFFYLLMHLAVDSANHLFNLNPS